MKSQGVWALSTGLLLALPHLQIHRSTQEFRVALFPACLVLLSCLFPEGRAGPTTTCCLLTFVRALMHLMMNSQPFEKGLCLPETRTKYYKLKIAASLWNTPTSPTEYSEACKFASICIHIHNFHLTHQPCSIKMHCLTLWADDGV